VVFPGNRLLSPRFRAVIDFLEGICRGVSANSAASPS
jgi:hypothetical protein